MQLNALSRLHKYMRKSEKEAIIAVSFSQTLVWHFNSCESIRKIEKIQKRFLRIILKNYETLLCNNNKPTINSLMHNVSKWSDTLKILQHLLQDF